jgi:hypothetical protein
VVPLTLAVKSSRHGGKQLAIQPLLSGRNPDVFFDKKVRSLAEGDQYLDPIYLEKEMKARLGGKPISEKAFVPPKGTHRRCNVNVLLKHVAAAPSTYLCSRIRTLNMHKFHLCVMRLLRP